MTGAAKGIGRACVERLTRARFRVYAGVRSEPDGAALRRDFGDDVVPLQLDVTQADTIAAAAATIARAAQTLPLRGLVNNAGIAIAGPLEFLPPAELRRQLEVNVIGQVAVTQAMLPMLRAARGRIVNIGSISGRSALPLTGAYAASKFALEAITDSLRVELADAGIAVIIIEPGVIATPIWETALSAADAIMRELPPIAMNYYGEIIERVRTRAQGGFVRGLPADAVARVVESALVSRKPGTRYLVGRDARMRVLFELLPTRLRDRMILRRLKRI